MQLHNHSQYSIIDGRGLITDYLALAEKDGQKSFALTDHGTLGGIVELYKAAKDTPVKPIAGIELYVDAYELGTPANKNQFGYGHFTILAKNEAGYRALIAINNLAHRQFYQKPRVTLQQVLDNCEDWFILSGCMSSPINSVPYTDAENIVCQLQQRSAGVFLEVMWHDSHDEQFEYKQLQYLERVSDLYKATGLPVVITNDCHYAFPHQEQIHQGFLKRLHSKGELEFDGEGFFFKTKDEMQKLANYINVPNAVANAEDLSAMCELHIPEADKVNWHVPDITNGQPEATLRALVSDRLSSIPAPYIDRFELEMSVLRTSPAILNSYLVTKDVVDWCDAHGFIAAARGSMGGSLVSHLLGITKEDPIKYDLSFNRAVNPARPSIPDFDLDVSSSHRGEILDYLKQRYHGNIPIISYAHYGPKGALRKILRMEGKLDFDSVNALCKELPDNWPPVLLTWEPETQQFLYPEDVEGEEGDLKVEIDARQKRSYRYRPKWLEPVPEQYRNIMMVYQGLYATQSVHPSGLLVSGPERELEHEVPFTWIASSNTLVSSFDMYTLKKIGLFKLDVLGLKTLDQLATMERVSGTKVPNDDYDDPKVLAAFGADLLAEIFQMDGYACRSVLRNIKGVQTFEDIIAANTLARPGCAQFTSFYRGGYENLLREYPSTKEILGPTNGLILYQEQVMEIARVLADFDDAEQDDVKESIKYFRKENWSKTIEPLFAGRCKAKGIDATNILEAISKMASYTYNRAHAMTYAAIAYKMMWYKIHHSAVYYAAVFDQAEDKSRLVLESHFFGVRWVPADINESQSQTIVRGNEILLGLSSIKGVGPAAYEALSKVRPFTSKQDLLDRVERKKCNKAVVEALSKAFALESIGEPGTYESFETAFGFHYQFLNADASRELASWQKDAPNYRLGGFLIHLKIFAVKSPGQNFGKEMANCEIVNINGMKRAVIFPDTWRKARGHLYQGAPVLLEGSYSSGGSDFIVEHGGTYE